MQSFLLARDVAARSGLSVNTIRAYVGEARNRHRMPAPLPRTRGGSQLLRWPAQAIDDWVAAGCPPVAPPPQPPRRRGNPGKGKTKKDLARLAERALHHVSTEVVQ